MTEAVSDGAGRVERCCVCGRELQAGEGRYLLEHDVALCVPCHDEVRRRPVPNGEH
jgi:predicted CXXCH cytochrome family protein